MPKTPYLSMTEKLIPKDPDRYQSKNAIEFSLSEGLPLPKIPRTSSHDFLEKLILNPNPKSNRLVLRRSSIIPQSMVQIRQYLFEIS